MDGDIGIASFERAAKQLEELPYPTLEQLERQTTAFLYAIWRARGIMNKRIVSTNGQASTGNDKEENGHGE